MAEVLKQQGLLSPSSPEASGSTGVPPHVDGAITGGEESLTTASASSGAGTAVATSSRDDMQLREEVVENEEVLANQSQLNPLGAAVLIALDAIDPSPYQPRLVFNPDAIGALADTIQDAGLNNPITVRIKANGRYELVAGERRLRAFQLLRKSEIAAYVRELTDAEAAVMAVTDNDAREDLSDYERGRSYQRLLDDKVVKTQMELSRRVGRSMSTVSRCLAFFKLPPEVLSMLEGNPLMIGTKVVSDFVAIAEEGFPNLVVSAAIKINEQNMSQENALNWLKGEVRRHKNPGAPQIPRHLKHGGQSMADVKIDGRKIILQCPKDVNPEDLLKTIESALANTEVSVKP